MKKLLLFFSKWVVYFLSYITGNIIFLIGLVVVVGGFIDENWSMTIPGVAILLVGGFVASWMQLAMRKARST